MNVSALDTLHPGDASRPGVFVLVRSRFAGEHLVEPRNLRNLLQIKRRLNGSPKEIVCAVGAAVVFEYFPPVSLRPSLQALVGVLPMATFRGPGGTKRQSTRAKLAEETYFLFLLGVRYLK